MISVEKYKEMQREVIQQRKQEAVEAKQRLKEHNSDRTVRVWR